MSVQCHLHHCFPFGWKLCSCFKAAPLSMQHTAVSIQTQNLHSANLKGRGRYEARCTRAEVMKLNDVNTL